jgi:hypothetical protein
MTQSTPTTDTKIGDNIEIVKKDSKKEEESVLIKPDNIAVKDSKEKIDVTN